MKRKNTRKKSKGKNKRVRRKVDFYRLLALGGCTPCLAGPALGGAGLGTAGYGRS